MDAFTRLEKNVTGLPSLIKLTSSRLRLGTDSHSEFHLFERRLLVKASSVGRNDKM
jgi:hypothetical protein